MLYVLLKGWFNVSPQRDFDSRSENSSPVCIPRKLDKKHQFTGNKELVNVETFH